MMSLHSLVGFLVTTGAVFLMMYAGLGKGALEVRHRRFCPSCGRATRDCRCGR
jgi:hypothetical protein